MTGQRAKVLAWLLREAEEGVASLALPRAVARPPLRLLRPPRRPGGAGEPLLLGPPDAAGLRRRRELPRHRRARADPRHRRPHPRLQRHGRRRLDGPLARARAPSRSAWALLRFRPRLDLQRLRRELGRG